MDSRDTKVRSVPGGARVGMTLMVPSVPMARSVQVPANVGAMTCTMCAGRAGAGVRFAHEVHPSEIAYDYWTTVAAMEAIGHREAFGLN